MVPKATASARQRARIDPAAAGHIVPSLSLEVFSSWMQSATLCASGSFIILSSADLTLHRDSMSILGTLSAAAVVSSAPGIATARSDVFMGFQLAARSVVAKRAMVIGDLTIPAQPG